jgi:hypothetical protein
MPKGWFLMRFGFRGCCAKECYWTWDNMLTPLRNYENVPKYFSKTCYLLLFSGYNGHRIRSNYPFINTFYGGPEAIMNPDVYDLYINDKKITTLDNLFSNTLKKHGSTALFVDSTGETPGDINNIINFNDSYTQSYDYDNIRLDPMENKVINTDNFKEGGYTPSNSVVFTEDEKGINNVKLIRTSTGDNSPEGNSTISKSHIGFKEGSYKGSDIFLQVFCLKKVPQKPDNLTKKQWRDIFFGYEDYFNSNFKFAIDLINYGPEDINSGDWYITHIVRTRFLQYLYFLADNIDDKTILPEDDNYFWLFQDDNPCRNRPYDTDGSTNR